MASAATMTMTMKDWATSRIAAQVPVKVGDNLFQKIPSSLLNQPLPIWKNDASGKKVLENFTLASVLEGRCLIIVLPGANTPTCTTHLPQLVAAAETLGAVGVKIIVACVNRTDDVYAWAKIHDPANKLQYIPDMTGEFILALGIGSWSDRLGLMGNRVAIVKDESHDVIAIMPELDANGIQCNGQCTTTGTNIAQKVHSLFEGKRQKTA